MTTETQTRSKSNIRPGLPAHEQASGKAACDASRDTQLPVPADRIHRYDDHAGA